MRGLLGFIDSRCSFVSGKSWHFAKSKVFILGGAGLGILLSIIIALVLSFLFPLSSAGRNREIL